MALPVLDGNQSATTLSSVVTGGEHIVAHSVVSLGSTAISNIATAVSGANVTVAGTVTAYAVGRYAISGNTFQDKNIATDANGQTLINAIVNAQSVFSYDGQSHIFAKLTPNTTVTIGSIPAISGTVTANINGTPTVTIPQLNRVIQSVATDGVADTNLNFVKIGGHQDGSNQTAHIVHVSAGGAMKVDATDSSVTFGAVRGTVTISNFPSTQTIAGTVTANAKGIWSGDSNLYDIPVLPAGAVGNGTRIPVSIVDSQGNTIGIGADGADRFLVDANITNPLTIGSLPAISGTVTAAAPNGSLTTRFGTPTTANVSFATSAVTNANRKYLLIQNVTTGSNVITVGIGFTPTTTQGIQLTAGAGITFESSYIPTGAVYVLSSVTASNFTILEA